MPRPDFFIVGAPKCGTTAMVQYLDDHPDIFFPDAKEVHFFGTDLVSRHYTRDLNRYLSLFNDWKGQNRIGEASVWYLYSKKAAEEIHAFDPDARIIIMLRNPVEMIYSNYYQLFFNGDEDIPTFEEALAAEPDRKAGRRIPNDCRLVESLFYRDGAMFTNQVQRYFDVFGREAVHVIIFDDFKLDVAQSYRQTLQFLGVDADFTTDFPRVNANKMVRSRTLKRLLQPIPNRLRQLRRFRVLRRGFRKFNQFNTRYVSRPAMNPDLRQQLQSEFAPEVERLGALLDRDLMHWVNPD